MPKSRPTFVDKARIATMSKDNALKELRKRALNGESEWVMLLLKKTDYTSIATLLKPATWKNEDAESLKNVAAVVRHVLESAPREQLPAKIDPSRVNTEFRQAVLRKLPKVKLKPRK